MTDLITIAILVGIGILTSILPEKVMDGLTNVFSLGQVGIRTIRRRNDRSDTLTNFILFLCFVFSFGYLFVPYWEMVYCILFGVSYLCLIAQTNRIAHPFSKRKRISVLLAVWLMSAIAFAGAIGLFNHHQFIRDINIFSKVMYTHNIYSYFYYLTNHEWVSALFEGVIMFASFYVTWAQFKYMRLENSFKANTMIRFWIKIVLVCIILIGLSFGGYCAIKYAYYL